MDTHVDKIQEKKTQSESGGESEMMAGGKSTFRFMDNRPEAIAQRKLQEAANNSPQVKQFRALQEGINDSPRVRGEMPLFAASSPAAPPVLRKENGKALQELANNSPQVSQLRAFEDMENNSHPSEQAVQLVRMASKAEISGDSPIQMVKPADKTEAQALTIGTKNKVKNPGDRHGGKHGGKELKAQLIKEGADSAIVDALTFKEYDVNGYDGIQRDAERIVEASDGRIFYTSDHYVTFVEIT
jgi:ribonuclease